MFSRIATKHIPQNQHEFSSKSPFSANYKSSTLPFDKSFVKIKQEGALRKLHEQLKLIAWMECAPTRFSIKDMTLSNYSMVEFAWPISFSGMDITQCYQCFHISVEESFGPFLFAIVCNFVAIYCRC